MVKYGELCERLQSLILQTVIDRNRRSVDGRLLPVGKLIASGRFGAETGGWFLVRIIFSGSIEPEYPLHSLSRSYWQQLKGRRHE